MAANDSPALTDQAGVSRVLVVAPPDLAAWWCGLPLGPGLQIVPSNPTAALAAVGAFDGLVVAGPGHDRLLSAVRAADPDAGCILDPPAGADPVALVNQRRADRLWRTGEDPQGAADLLWEVVEEALLRRHNRALLEELSQRNAELLDFNARLEEQVEERTTHLREAHLRLQAQQQALLRLETHGMLTHLARGLAHELNNPLAAILGFAQRLRRQAADDETRRRLQVILDEVERCRKLVEQIHHLAAPLDEAITTVDPATALDRAMARHRSSGRLLPQVSIHGRMPSVLAAPEALARIIEEGLENAVQAGAQSVVMAAETLGEHVRLTLANDGTTPSADDAFNATKPFFTTRAHAGAQGLGLAVAAGLAREQDGHLELLPGRCGGAVLAIHLPSASRVESQAAEAAAAAAASGAILIVDDQPLVAELLRDLVQDLGYTVLMASDVRSALACIGSTTVAGILTDLHLPDGSGQALATEAARLCPHLVGRVAVVTGDPEAVGGGLPVLAKPFRAEQVGFLLHHVVGQPA